MQGLRRRLIVAAAIAPVVSIVGISRAADVVFTNSGDWNTPTNWTPPGPPGVMDRADIAGGLTATISTTPTSAVDTLYVGGNTDGPSANDSATSNTAGNGTVNQTGGDLVVNTWAVVGEISPTAPQGANAGTGTYNLSGGSFTLNGTDNLAVGQGGTGVFNVSGNATVNINSIMNVGRWSGVTGTIGDQNGRGNGTVVQGGTSTVTIMGHGGAGNTEALNVGVNGDGSYTLKDNATLNVAIDVNVANGAASTGTFTQTGGTFNNTGGWFFVGHNADTTGSAHGTYNLSARPRIRNFDRPPGM